MSLIQFNCGSPVHSVLRLSPNRCVGKKREFRFHPIKEAVLEEPADITPWLDQLDDTMKEKVLQLQKTR